MGLPEKRWIENDGFRSSPSLEANLLANGLAVIRHLGWRSRIQFHRLMKHHPFLQPPLVHCLTMQLEMFLLTQRILLFLLPFPLMKKLVPHFCWVVVVSRSEEHT